jgi:hypothetical protein
MIHKPTEKHKPQFPSGREIRRACSKELYRTAKRLKVWISPEQMKQAEEVYTKEVILNLAFIVDTGSNRKLLSDWWDEHVCPQISQIWNVDPSLLSRSFRDAFGG